MERRALGRTGLSVSEIGLGGGSLDGLADAAPLLRSALDLGVTLFDTAPSYGSSEAAIGGFYAGLSSSDRERVVLSTKVGYGAEGHSDWSYGCVIANVEAALSRLRCERIGVVFLHSCDRATLERGDVVRALDDAKRAGKIQCAGYSGDDDALATAIDTGAFDVVQTSISTCDPWSARNVLPRAKELGVGVIAKRALATAAFAAERPAEHASAIYWDRWRAIAAEVAIEDPRAVSLRFALKRADVVLVGTRQLEHLRWAIDQTRYGALPPEVESRIEDAHTRHASCWGGVV